VRLRVNILRGWESIEVETNGYHLRAAGIYLDDENKRLFVYNGEENEK
jgi:hypothetical protein